MGNRGTVHSSCYPGKRVVVRLRDGQFITGRFQEKHSRYIVVEGQKIPREKVESLSIQKCVMQHKQKPAGMA
jgi:hypothetical protein